MGIEEDLFEALKYATMGGKSVPFDNMLKVLMNSVEINTLKRMQVDLAKMQEQLGKRILELTRQIPASKGTTGTTMDPYTILGVSPDASKEEVEAAYRSKAKKHHPDVTHAETDEQMMMINAAYAAIKQFKGWS
jgi:DnaJ-domain-containing protein 1